MLVQYHSSHFIVRGGLVSQKQCKNERPVEHQLVPAQVATPACCNIVNFDRFYSGVVSCLPVK